MSHFFHGDNADWIVPDSSPSDESWHELHRLAQRAGVSVEHLCLTVETATHFSCAEKATSPTCPDDNLDEVIRILTDDDYGFESETKAEWHEADHPRAPNGRFSNGSDLFSLLRRVTPKEQRDTEAELTQLQTLLQNTYRGLNSRWKKKLALRHFTSFGFLGTKDWECTISMAYELIDHPAYRVGTLLHESLHSFSPTTRDDYRASPGWEEAVIENITQLHQEAFAKQMGLSISKKEFEERNEQHSYVDICFAMERLRRGLGKDPHIFYDEILRIPASQRQEYIVREARKLPPEEKDKFRNIFRIYAKRLDDFTPPKPGTSHSVKAKRLIMTQDEVIDIMLSARTPAQIINAKEVMMNWMRAHPSDFKVASGGEMLELLAQAHGIKNPNRYTPPMTIIDCATGEITELTTEEEMRAYLDSEGNNSENNTELDEKEYHWEPPTEKSYEI